MLEELCIYWQFKHYCSSQTECDTWNGLLNNSPAIAGCSKDEEEEDLTCKTEKKTTVRPKRCISIMSALQWVEVMRSKVKVQDNGLHLNYSIYVMPSFFAFIFFLLAFCVCENKTNMEHLLFLSNKPWQI